MNVRRLSSVWILDVAHNLRRPLFWILLLLVGFTAYGLSSGKLQIASGDATVGGQKAWITSEFAVAQMLTLVVFLAYTFFIAVAAGMSVIQDDELKVGELLHATPLRPREYVWGKFLAVLFSFVAVLAVHLLCMIFFNQVMPNAKAAEIRGPFALMNYLRPVFFLVLPSIVFLTGASFAIGEISRKPILIFVLPTAFIMGSIFFLWEWTPSWLDPRVDRVLMLIDPAGFRWLNQTWLKVDRGVEFYNHAPIQFDTAFLLSRLALVGLGLGLVVVSQRHLASALGGSRSTSFGPLGLIFRNRRKSAQPNETIEAPGAHRPLAALGMHSVAPGFLRGTLAVARGEFRSLLSHPGLYLFIPIILLQTIGTSMVAVGAFDTPLLQTSGTLAVGAMNTLTLLVCLLLLFYTVESVQRERHTRLASIHYATPVPTGSILFGKCIANGFIGAVILLATFLGCAIVLLVQGKVGIELRPFLLVWGLLLPVTFLGWTAFVTAVLALSRNRYTTYAICLGAIIATGYFQSVKQMNWVGNWDLWSVLRWSDMETFELNGKALLLNRIMVLGLAVFFTVLAVRLFPRRDRDGVRTLQRLQPWSLVKSSFRLLPYAAVPLAAGAFLWLQVFDGFEGDAAKKRQKDFWRKNLATWKDARVPDLLAVNMDVDLEPARRWMHVKGHYDLRNHHDKELARFSVTGGDRWEKLHWTMDGRDYEPEDRAGLYVFTPPRALATGDRLQIGFEYEATYPRGVTKNGGGTREFILSSGVHLSPAEPGFIPTLGFRDDIGIDDDNRYESRVYPDDFYKGITEPAWGSPSTFTTQIRITAPAEYTLNSVGTRVSDSVADGRRTTVWESDHPVRLFDIVAGRWAERRGNGTVVYYHPGHTYNIDAMVSTLDAARKYYSEWFCPYPWRELKLSEFPNLAGYATGFPTNIAFSEGIGFLTKNDEHSDMAFLVTAHEAAHQWWGNILTPGKGPGGNILSEGMAHFSTILLHEQVKGPQGRMEFCKRIEERYNEHRRRDSERPLVKIDGDRPGDTTVTYDKGGWVFWMLLQHMGRERALKGIQAFIRQYANNRDFPVLQDFVASMRPFAKDQKAYDAFVHQWFFEVAVPEYRLSEARREPIARDATPASLAAPSGESWQLTVRVENAGAARMPVAIAAAAGERFQEDGSTSPDYRDARTTVILGAGESKEVTIPCSFKPDRVLVDPDVMVLQLLRKAALVRF